MKAKLIKTQKGYYLDTGEFDGIHLACYPHDVTKQRLSIKNCQAIERGYDLDELTENFIEKTGYHDFDSYSYKLGFQKALELMGDKKFSHGQLLNAMDLVWQWINGEDYGCETLTEVQDKHIKSLQQTEWDVEIEMDILNEYDQPKLDADGCLILKLKSE